MSSRQDKMRRNRLGFKAVNEKTSVVVRASWLDQVDKYLECLQYKGKTDWDEALRSEDFVPVRDRNPRINFALADILTKRLQSKLLGKDQFPVVSLDDDPATEEFWNTISEASYFKARMMDAAYDFCSKGAVFVRFKLVAGNLFLESYNVKYCYPVFNEAYELSSLEVKYVYTDVEDLDQDGNPIKKWYKLFLTETADTLFDNPKYTVGEIPSFTVVSQVEHNLGFVQGEWIRNHENKHSPDGNSFILKIMDFIDSINYNLSQTDGATSYGLDPQLILKNMEDDEIDSLIKSSSKGWNLGREGEAALLEATGSGLERAEETRDDLMQRLMETSRIIMLDPEKIMGHAQSGRAMEILHGPLVELINELRPFMEKGIKILQQKIIAMLVVFIERGADIFLTTPPNYKPKSLDFSYVWGRVFPQTVQDLLDKSRLYTGLTQANIVSRETALRKLAPDLGIPDDEIESEVQRIATQPQFGFFGGF